MITAELFSSSAAENQAAGLHQLVQSEKAWLQEARPGVLDNYSTEKLAIEAVRRMIESRSLTGYVLRRNMDVIGIGTVVSNLVIKHPVPQGIGSLKLRGDQIDYWTEEIPLEEHRAAALALTEATRTPKVLGLLTKAEEERAQGIVDIMQKVGAPGPVGIPLWRRDYGIPQIEEPL